MDPKPSMWTGPVLGCSDPSSTIQTAAMLPGTGIDFSCPDCTTEILNPALYAAQDRIGQIVIWLQQLNFWGLPDLYQQLLFQRVNIFGTVKTYYLLDLYLNLPQT